MLGSNDSTDADLVRMSHRFDPDTSAAAARAAKRGDKKRTIQNAIVAILADGPATAREIYDQYVVNRYDRAWPFSDLYDIRRRLTELKLDTGRVVDTGERRNGEAVMAVAE